MNRMIKNVHHNPDKYQIDVNKFYRFEKHLIELEGKLLDGYVFQVLNRPITKTNSTLIKRLFSRTVLNKYSMRKPQ